MSTFELLIERKCSFLKRPKRGCDRCGLGKLHPDHLGLPPSINETVGKDRMTYLRVKEAWHRVLAEALERALVPRHAFESVYVNVLLGLPTYREQDEGNRRWLLEKAFGDTLVGGYVKTKTERGHTVKEQVIAGGWLPDDSFWPTLRYRMGSIEAVHTPGEASVRLEIYPSWDVPVRAPRAGETETLL